jgi:hypothetical protein
MTSKRIARHLIATLLWLAAACLHLHAAQVVYVGKPQAHLFSRQEMETAASFYGLDRKVFLLTGKGDTAAALEAIHDHKTVAVILAADALSELSQEKILAALRRGRESSVPLLISGITAQTRSETLSAWSAGAIEASHVVRIENGNNAYEIASVNDVTRQLSGSRLPLEKGETTYLALGPQGGGNWIMAAKIDGDTFPVFTRSRADGQEIFFATARLPIPVTVTPDPYIEPLVFSNLAPMMMFLRYAAAERAWHSAGHYANLTIDDLWLREPYGHVNYGELLKQMEQYNFHTTIAFIPWNFDRSTPEVVSLFGQHPGRFSICVHGNNHYHQEFGSYDSNPLTGQIENIKQGLARMDRFSQLTKLPYDPVMVFPHSISQALTLAALKRYNFAATANSVNVPNGSEAPSDPEFVLRPVTMAFSNFPSLKRYSAEAPISVSQLAIDAFLGSPMLFYVHQGFFAAGAGAFSGTADTVNHIQPDTQWQSLGNIARHLYLEKLRDDGNYDVRAYSGTIQLENALRHDVRFYVTKDEDFASPLTVRVDGKVYPYQRSNAELRIELPVGAGASREITIRYENDLKVATVDVGKLSIRINVTRYLSDFRDNTVSATALGRRFIILYSENETNFNRALSMLAALLLIMGIVWLIWKGTRRLPQGDPSLTGIAPRNH